jgi:peptidoglycan/LPS O-acetylase OafA/YrhL/lysophospholipase L1-like esterase
MAAKFVWANGGCVPRPIKGDQRYLPGLDGLRALAVMAVVAYHLGLGWVPGGMLGVGVFFTLSGYLITDLLLAGYHRTGRLDLADFWRRRARRLLPAVLVMMTVVLAWVTALDRSQLPALRGVAISALGYVSNWWLIAQHSSYFARFGPASPLGHLWSLAVEEQFYLVWPWLLWFGLRWVRGRPGYGASRPGDGRPGDGLIRPGGLGLLAKGTLLLAAASAIEMGVLYSPGYDPTRIYDGTDTRAFALLIGAALAFVWPSRRLTAQVTEGARRVLDIAGGAGLAIILVLILGTGEYSAFVYRGGMVLLSVATLLVVGAAASPASRVGQVLGCRPLRWIGVRSYGIYLWHYPIIVLTTPAGGHVTFVRGTLQLAASFLAAALSWKYVEEPIRHGLLGRWWTRARSSGWRLADFNPARLNPVNPDLSPAGRRRWAAAASAVVVCGVAGAGLTGAVQPGSAAQLAAGSVPAPRSEAPTRPAGPARTPAASPTQAGGAAPSPAARAGITSTRTSCRSVVHIGDSTSDGLVSADYLPNPQQRIGAQYAKVGATRLITEISGGRSIVETVGNQSNAYDVAKKLMAGGYRGCWVLALGTNDTADVVVGSAVSRPARIEKMMSVIGNQPVLWVNVKSLVGTGPYAENAMQRWDTALTRACSRYPGMRVYDWADVAQDSWFISDGIHYTSAGYAARSAGIAHALAEAFPAGSSHSASNGCVVH